MRIVTLCENRLEPSFGLKASHGLSLYIEYKDYHLLYDVGQDDVFLENAKILGIDLSKCENIIVSHGHLDHAGGLAFLKNKVNLNKVIINKNAFKERVRLNHEKIMDIGISNKLRDLNIGKDINGNFELTKGVWCISNVEILNDSYGLEKGLFIRDDEGNLKDDTFEDELNLAIETSKGLVVVSGCSHRGVINILRNAQKTTGINKINTFVGGLHLNSASKEEVLKVIDKLKEFNINRLIVGHCTGPEAIALIKQYMPENTEVVNNYVGYELDMQQK